MSDMSDELPLCNEYIPYTAHHPRRSTRQRSVPHQLYNPVPEMRSAKPQSKRSAARTPVHSAARTRTPVYTAARARTPVYTAARSRTRSIPRDADYYTSDEVAQAPKWMELKRNLQDNMFAAGCNRIPLLTEIMKVSVHVIAMRWEEIHLVEDAIVMMENSGIGQGLINDMKKGVATLKWEMDERNVREGDLPRLGPETTNFTDISTWLIFYFDLLHDNMHRIIDLNYGMTMLSKSDRKKLCQHEKKAREIIEEFEKSVESFNLEGESYNAYKKVVDEIRRNCDVCK